MTSPYLSDGSPSSNDGQDGELPANPVKSPSVQGGQDLQDGGVGEEAGPPRKRLAPRTLTLLVSGISALVLLAVMTMLPVPYVVETPGPTFNTLGKQDGAELIKVPDKPSHKVTGELRLVTVSVYGADPGSLSLLQFAKGWLNSTDKVTPYDAVYRPGSTSQEREKQAQGQMLSSQEMSSVAALYHLGIDVPIAVGGFAPDADAEKQLRVGDVIEQINGEKINSYQQLRQVVGKVAPGQPINVGVKRGGKPRTVKVRTMKDEASKQAILGIQATFKIPVSITFGVKEIGGPSAGLMFALGIVDKLGDVDLAGGHIIAGTGTMSGDGSVGAIGGIRQKMVGARGDGAQYFFAPSENCSEVTGYEPDGLSVVKTKTLKDTVDSLALIRAGKDDQLPRCSAR